jgi:hypothetical protein
MIYRVVLSATAGWWVFSLLVGCSQSPLPPSEDHRISAQAQRYGSHIQSAVQVVLSATRRDDATAFSVLRAELRTRAPAYTPSGPIVITDAQGNPLVRAALPQVRWEVEAPPAPNDTPPQNQVRLATQQTVVLTLPWPEGAAFVKLDDQRVSPSDLRSASVDQPIAEPLHQSGSSEHRFDIVVLGDGYTSSELEKFRDDARRFWQEAQVIEPLQTFRDRINVWMIPTPSVDGQIGESSSANTPYGCYYNCDGVERAICCDPARVADHASLVPSYEGVLVIVNDDRWGGAARPNYATTYRGPWLGAVGIHEMGHQAILLGDEYSYGVTGTPTWGPIPNCSLSPTTTPWDYWRGREGVDVHRHCGFTNYYKPVPDDACLMYSIGMPMCAVCREAWAREIAEASSTGDWPVMTLLSAAPEATDDAMQVTDSLTLQATVQVPAAPAFAVPRYDWTLGATGMPAPGELTYQVGACGLPAGQETPVLFEGYFAPVWVRPALAPTTVTKASTSWRVRRADDVHCEYLFLPAVHR